ncbi:SdiA-regulated domain-containing protein [Rubrivirga sp.]|uniref:SdiA-regulated domain-containing protein n=1 Tax=Rubrivirga sp. TaxID=1885344 RepID=UPI003C72195B
MRLLALLLALSACAEPSQTPAAAPVTASHTIPYALDTPDAVVDLPSELREISGLTVVPSGRLGAVQDEDGILYEIDPATGAIVDRLTFEGSGDYEGVALALEAVWVLRSDGDLYRVGRDSTGAPSTRKVETSLRGRNDTEGLAYDAASGTLLVACKENPGPDLDGLRAIYAFDLEAEAMSDQPVFVLDRRVVDRGRAFKPSAIAVHPNGEVYVVSSVRRSIAVLSREGELLTVADLPSIAPQPEGIAFAADGTLYIASEGPSGPGRLLRYAPTR